MQSNYHLRSKFYFVGVLASAFLLASCGSYQYAGYEEDSIYGSSNEDIRYVENTPTQDSNVETSNQDDSGYYDNYFRDKTTQYGSVTEDDVIFTDIDSYQGSYAGEGDYNEGYAGWGEDHNEDVVINIYGGHLFNSIRWNRPWGWNYGWNIGLNWWNNPWGWNTGWGWGWNNPWGWNTGFGWGWGWNNPWYWNTGFWCPPFGGFYGNGYGYYGSRAVAFNASRRNANGIASLSRRSSANNNANSNVGRRGTSLNGQSSYNRNSRRSRTDVNRPNNSIRPNTAIRPNTSSRPANTRPPSNSTRPSTKIDRRRTRPYIGNSNRTNPRINNSSRTGSRSRAVRSTRSNPNFGNRSINRSRSSGVNRSSSGNRSSGFSRSSSPSRSSGRSSGRSGGSRRNN